MVRYINSNESAAAAGNGQSFRLGQTVFVVAGPAVPRKQGRSQGLSLTSLTIPLPLDDAQHDESQHDDAQYAIPPHDNPPHAHEPHEPAPVARDADADPDIDLDAEHGIDDGDDFDSAQVRGTELLAPPPQPPVAGPLERRLASIIPGDPDPADVGLTPASPQRIYSDLEERPSR